MTVQPVQQMVDELLDQVRAEHPGVEFSIVLSVQESLLLPMHGDKLWRGAGYYRGHVYRDCLVESVGQDDVVVLVALDGAAPTYYGLLMTGETSTNSPLDAGPA